MLNTKQILLALTIGLLALAHVQAYSEKLPDIKFDGNPLLKKIQELDEKSPFDQAQHWWDANKNSNLTSEFANRKPKINPDGLSWNETFNQTHQINNSSNWWPFDLNNTSNDSQNTSNHWQNHHNKWWQNHSAFNSSHNVSDSDYNNTWNDFVNNSWNNSQWWNRNSSQQFESNNNTWNSNSTSSRHQNKFEWNWNQDKNRWENNNTDSSYWQDKQNKNHTDKKHSWWHNVTHNRNESSWNTTQETWQFNPSQQSWQNNNTFNSSSEQGQAKSDYDFQQWLKDQKHHSNGHKSNSSSHHNPQVLQQGSQENHDHNQHQYTQDQEEYQRDLMIVWIVIVSIIKIAIGYGFIIVLIKWFKNVKESRRYRRQLRHNNSIQQLGNLSLQNSHQVIMIGANQQQETQQQQQFFVPQQQQQLPMFQVQQPIIQQTQMVPRVMNPFVGNISFPTNVSM